MSETSIPEGALFASFRAAEPALVTGVPDGMLAATISSCQASDDFPYIACAREEECIGVACGAAMAGERAIMLVQNAGLLNAIGVFSTMALRYQLPFVIIVTNRGVLADPNSYDIEKFDAFETSVKSLSHVFTYNAADLPDDLVPAAFRWAQAARRPPIIALERRL